MIISIIIPVYGHWGETLSCIEAVLNNTNPELNYEIIVADDNSPNSNFIEPAFHNKRIKYFKNEKNLGYLLNCNEAVKKAQGDLLVFLNSDTIPQPFWLDWLVKTFEDCGDIGVVGAKLLFPDGRLQESGAAVWNNALGHRYGCGDNPQLQAYNYVKEVDYVSFACAAVLRIAWDNIGGFDTQFAPAYKEDVDFCFAARQAGYRVLYQPKCEVVHIGGLSYLSNEPAMQKHEVNHGLFRKKWEVELKEHENPNSDLFFARDRSRGKKVIFAALSFSPENNILTENLMFLTAFKTWGYKVALHLLQPLPEALTEEIQQWGIELVADLHGFVREYSSKIDFVFCSHPDTYDTMQLLKDKTRAKILYYDNLRQCIYAKKFSSGFNRQDMMFFALYKEKEAKLLGTADKFLVPTFDEFNYIKQNYPDCESKVQVWNIDEIDKTIFE